MNNARLHRKPARRHVMQLSLVASALAWPAASQAIDFGPFSLTGFAKAEIQRSTNQCPDCQRFPGEDKQRFWADEIVYGSEYKSRELTTTLFQPYLGAKFDLGGGVKLSGLLSQRWRDGKPDIEGFLYERNVALSHEDYGSLRIGSMTTRTWSVADYPYGTNLNLADFWGSAGAGYGLLTYAARYTSRTLDVLEGDLVLEATYDGGNTDFKQNKPMFWEFYGQYHKGDLVVDAMWQIARNGTPNAWSHGPFTGLTPHAADDSKLGSSGQSIIMAMARYQLNSKIEVSGGIRRNRWSGAYAVVVDPGPPSQWNNMFNVNWNGTDNKGYAAHSVDVMAGARYRFTEKLIGSTGLAVLGKASTGNPSERGQSNSATEGTLGLNYDYGYGLQVYGFTGFVHFSRLGLSPLSMPRNTAFTGVDSRVTRNGVWFGGGVVYVF